LRLEPVFSSLLHLKFATTLH